jgi:hypothetical protein
LNFGAEVPATSTGFGLGVEGTPKVNEGFELSGAPALGTGAEEAAGIGLGDTLIGFTPKLNLIAPVPDAAGVPRGVVETPNAEVFIRSSPVAGAAGLVNEKELPPPKLGEADVAG